MKKAFRIAALLLLTLTLVSTMTSIAMADYLNWSEDTSYIPYETGEDKPVIEYTEPVEPINEQILEKDITIIVCIIIVAGVAVVCTAVILIFKLKARKSDK